MSSTRPERSEPWTLEDVTVRCTDMLDADLATAAFISLQIGHGRLDVNKRTARFFRDLAAELADLANWREAYLEHLGILLRDEEPSDGSP